MTEKERVTVDLDAECYYLDGEFWTSWDHYGEEMADEINKLLNEQEEQLKPFINLARDYNLTLNQLFDICSECIDKLDSIYEQKGYGDVE